METLTLDQLRVFVEVVETGSFSGAGRRLHRAQSAISYAISNLEESLGISLFDRSSRIPQLTDKGKVLLLEARKVLGQVSQLRERAMHLAGEVEPEVSFAVTTLFPMPLIVEVCHRFKEQYSHVGLRLYFESLGMVVEHVLKGTCQFGISGPDGLEQPGLVHQPLTRIPMLPVVSPSHPLSALPEPVSEQDVESHVQIVVTDRSRLTEGIDKGVFSDKVWRVADLETKHELLRAGLGWGGMPLFRVQEDLEQGKLRKLNLKMHPEEDFEVPLSLIWQKSRTPGPAARWLMKELKTLLKSGCF